MVEEIKNHYIIFFFYFLVYSKLENWINIES